MNKIPAITISFWIIKICATTLGETAGDLLSMTMNAGYAASSIIFLSFFVITLLIQLNGKRYRPEIYWLVILATSTSGTTISDFMDRTLGLGYATGSVILVSLLTIILLVWKKVEKTISVEKINSFSGELFYWTAILISNTLGTAFGDYLSDNSGMGFLGSALFLAGLLLLVVSLYYFTKASHVILFWSAFVITRPLGATMGDYFTKPTENGGLNFGTIGTSALLLALIIVLIMSEIKRIKLRKAY